MFIRFFKAHKITVAVAGGVLLICAIAVGTVLGIQATTYSCKMKDISSNEKVDPSVLIAISRYNLNLEDYISLDLYFDSCPDDEEIRQLEELGGRVYEDICMQARESSCYCLSRYKVMDICRLFNVDSIKRIEAPEQGIKLQE